MLGAAPVAAATLTPGTIATVVGSSTPGYTGDGGAATAAELHEPTGVTVDAHGNLVVLDQDSGSPVVRVVAESATNPGYDLSTGCPLACTTSAVTWTPGDIYTIAGDGSGGYSGDGGPATSAELSGNDFGSVVALDHAGNVVIDETSNHAVRVVAVSATNPGYPVSTGCPSGCITAGVTWTPGDIYTIAGTGFAAYTGDGGPASSAELDLPTGLGLDHAGNVLILDTGEAIRVLAVSATNPGYVLPSSCPAAESSCAGASALSTWTPGHIYTIAGTGASGFSGDGGPAGSAMISGEYASQVSADADGNVVFADNENNVVRVIAVSASNPGYMLPAQCPADESTCGGSPGTWVPGDIYTVAGTGQSGYAGDGGQATAAELAFEAGGQAAVDRHGNIVITDNVNNVLRVVAVSASNPGYVLPSSCAQSESSCDAALTTWTPGDIYTVAGIGQSGYTGDNSAATSAKLDLDYGDGIGFDAQGDVLFADTGNNVIREVGVASSPSAPTAPGAVTGNGSALVSWSAPGSGGGYAITGYDVFAATTSGGENYSAAPACTATGADSSCTVTGLTNGVNYYFTVEALNQVGPGLPSAEATATPATVPGAPTRLRAAAGVRGATLSWSVPASNGGSAVMRYKAYEATKPGAESYSGAPACVATGPVASGCTVTGLSPGKSYYVTVEAVNAVGAGAPSGQVSATPSAGSGTTKLRSVKSSGGSVTATLACVGPTGATCPDTLKLTTTGKKPLVAARGRVTVIVGKTRKLKLKLSGTAKRLLARRGRLSVKLSISSGGRTVATGKLTLNSASHRKHG
jgi:hypothetical protein